MLSSSTLISRVLSGVCRLPLGIKICIVLAGIVFLLPRLPGSSIREGIPSSQAVYDRHGKLLRLSIADDEKYRLWVPLSKMHPSLIAATLLKEDRYYWYHPGVNPWALARAFWGSFVAKDARSGGSTITMQLARIRYRLKTRTIIGKTYQIVIALRLELFHTKKEILEAYLNLAPYGGNVEGAGAASLIYFAKDVDHLSLAEVLTLAVIPQSPSELGTDVMNKSREQLLDAWIRKFKEYVPDRSRYVVLPTLHKPSELPFLAPHLVEDVMRMNPGKVKIVTTIDLGLQNLMERQIHDFVQRKSGTGIRNTAALLVDTRSMDVLASVGSADYFDNRIQGQVNGTRAERSPGSSLKPFLYALAFQQGIAHSMTMLMDSPFGVGGFNPENFDGEFHGPLTVHDALIQSRNVPAVQVATMLKDPDLYDFLKSAGVDLPKSREHYGLALVLGGAEVTMEDEARLYCMLANEGIMRPLHFVVRNEKDDKGTRLLSREACFMVLDILKDNPRPDQHYQESWLKDPMPVYWKTGTSYGFKDAWTVGITGPYVLAVWVGNFNGVGNPSFVGVRAAAPLFFQIVDAINAIHRDEEYLPWLEGQNIQEVNVCAVSGGLPNQWCPTTVPTLFIPGTSPITKCEVHRSIPVDIRTGLRVIDSNRPGTRMETFEFWPSDILKIYRLAGIPRRVPPPYHPSCAPDDITCGQPPKITSPQRGLIYHSRSRDGQDEGISLTAVSDAGSRTLCWFANKQYLGKVPREAMFVWKPKPGQYVVRVVDDQGRSDATTIRVHAVN